MFFNSRNVNGHGHDSEVKNMSVSNFGNRMSHNIRDKTLANKKKRPDNKISPSNKNINMHYVVNNCFNKPNLILVFDRALHFQNSKSK